MHNHCKKAKQQQNSSKPFGVRERKNGFGSLLFFCVYSYINILENRNRLYIPCDKWYFSVYFYVYGCFACVYVFVLDACLVHTEARKGIRVPGIGATDNCELCWALNPGPLEEQ